MGSQRKRMLEKNSRCGKRKIFHNDGFYCRKSCLISVKSCLNVESTIYVSHLIHLTHFCYKKCINFNPVIIRDTKPQSTHCLYNREKQVFLLIKLAFKSLGEKTNESEVIRKSQRNTPRKNSKNSKNCKNCTKYTSYNEPNVNFRNFRNCRNYRNCRNCRNYKKSFVSHNSPLPSIFVTSVAPITFNNRHTHIKPHVQQPYLNLYHYLDSYPYHLLPLKLGSYTKHKEDDKRYNPYNLYNLYFYLHFIIHTTLAHLIADEGRSEENVYESREDPTTLKEQHEQHEQRDQREQRERRELREL